MSDTPRTDAHIGLARSVIMSATPSALDGDGAVVPANFARELERELNALTITSKCIIDGLERDIKKLQTDLAESEALVMSHKGCIDKLQNLLNEKRADSTALNPKCPDCGHEITCYVYVQHTNGFVTYHRRCTYCDKYFPSINGDYND